MKVAAAIYIYFCYLILTGIFHPLLINAENNGKRNSNNTKSVSESDSQLVNSYNSLAWEIAHNDINSSIYLSKKALLISRKIKNKQSIASSLLSLGRLYYMKNLHDSALYYFNEAVDIVKKLHNDSQLITAYNDIILTYNGLYRYEESIKYGLLALELSEKNNDTTGIVKSLTTLGWVYHNLHDYNNAIKYYSQSFILAKKAGKQKYASSILNIMGLIYFERGISQNQNYLDSSLYYHRMALDYGIEINAENEIAESYVNIGNVYSEKNNIHKALYYYNLSKSIYYKLENYAGLSSLLYDIANLHFRNNEADKAISNYKKSIEVADGINNTELLKANYYSIAEAYSLKKDFKSAYEYSNKHNILADSINNLESNKQIAEISTSYESQKKENILLKQNTEIKLSELRRSRTILLISAMIIVAFVVLVVILIRSLRNIKKTTQLLVDQNFLITQKSDIITDNLNYAKIIQTALLPSHNDFKKLFRDSFILFMPKDIIGGDIIWFKYINGTKIFAL
ncbi:MAG: tetratricopeptide repeat protein, partial [Bacteroidales bacterium]